MSSISAMKNFMSNCKWKILLWDVRTMADWRNVSAVLGFLFGMIVVWAAMNGKFTTQQPVLENEPCEKLKVVAKNAVEELKRVEDAAFDYESAALESDAIRRDQRRASVDLLDNIGDLTRRIAELEKENAALRKALKDAMEAIDELRRRLSICNAQDTARRLEAQWCDTEPSGNSLL